jgi:hypothetical protein
MRPGRWWCALLLSSACGRLGFDVAPDASGADTSGADAFVLPTITNRVPLGEGDGPALAWVDNQFVAVWFDSVALTYQVATFSASGDALLAPRPLGSTGDPGALAPLGSELAATTGGSNMVGIARFAADGSNLRETPVGSGYDMSFAVNRDGSGLCGAWVGYDGVMFTLQAARLDTEGASQGATFGVTTGGIDLVQGPAVGCHGDRFEIVWVSATAGADENIQYRAWNADSVIVDETEIASLDASYIGLGGAVLARTDVPATVAYVASGRGAIVGQFDASAPSALTEVQLSEDATNATLQWTGNRFAVLWTRVDGTEASVAYASLQRDLTLDGMLTISDLPGISERAASVAAAPTGELAVGYTVQDVATSAKTVNIAFLR